MKHFSKILASVAILATFISCSKDIDNEHTKRTTITFEGTAWSKYVATESYSSAFVTEDYIWQDAETSLSSAPIFVESSWGGESYSYYGGGLTLSSYNSSSLNDYDMDNLYLADLYCYNPKNINSKKGGGNNGSDNFLVAYGNYEEGISDDMRPEIYFADGKARKVVGCYVCSTTYFTLVAEQGNSFSPALSGNDEIKIYATGYDATGAELNTVSMTLAKKDAITKSWTAWDLSALGTVVRIKFNIMGGPTDDWGMKSPKYFAIDDITVEETVL